jgi:hypothetical protein
MYIKKPLITFSLCILLSTTHCGRLTRILNTVKKQIPTSFAAHNDILQSIGFITSVNHIALKNDPLSSHDKEHLDNFLKSGANINFALKSLDVKHPFLTTALNVAKQQKKTCLVEYLVSRGALKLPIRMVGPKEDTIYVRKTDESYTLPSSSNQTDLDKD